MPSVRHAVSLRQCADTVCAARSDLRMLGACLSEKPPEGWLEEPLSHAFALSDMQLRQARREHFGVYVPPMLTHSVLG